MNEIADLPEWVDNLSSNEIAAIAAQNYPKVAMEFLGRPDILFCVLYARAKVREMGGRD